MPATVPVFETTPTTAPEPARAEAATPAAAPADWYKDAVIYQLHVKAFFDSNDDGMGDFRGLSEKLDYIKDLGVNTIWLLPFYPSPLRDDGYDVADYSNVHPTYGTRADFHQFVREAHRRELRVITELIVNHTSDQHPWFQAARRAPKGSSKRNWYVWSDDPKKYAGTRIIFTDTEKSNWAWDDLAKAFYWHRFFSHQPDLNFDNPQVRKAIFRVMRFWLDLGVDGFRLDAIPYLCEREGTNNENLPETHAVLKELRATLDAHYPGKLLLAEANQWPEDVREYFGDGDECHMAFHFPLMPRMYMAIAQEERHPITEIMGQTPDIPEPCQWAIFLRNHDELTLEMVTSKERDYMYQMYATDPRARVNVGIRRRLAPLLENDTGKIKLMTSLLLSMPGSPILYYGDEIGMGDNIYLGDRDGVRTPMQWRPERNAGFSRADPQRVYLQPIMDPIYGYEAVNVEAQLREPASLLNWNRRMLAVRNGFRAFGRGRLTFLRPGNRKILAYLREYGDEIILCVANLARSAQPVELDLARYKGRVPVELMGRTPFPPIGDLPYLLTLAGPRLPVVPARGGRRGPGVARGAPAARRAADARAVRRLGEPVSRSRRAVADHDVREGPRAARARGAARLRRRSPLVRGEGLGDRRRDARRLRRMAGRRPELARRAGPGRARQGGSRHLFPAADARLGGQRRGADANARGAHRGQGAPAGAGGRARRRLRRRRVLSRAGDRHRRRRARSRWRGAVCASGRRRRSRTLPARPTTAFRSPRPARRAANTIVALDERLFLKAYRRLQVGGNPEVEIGRFLTDVVHFRNSVPVAGSVEYVGADGSTTVLALLQAYVANQGDGWAYTLNHLDRVLEQSPAQPEPPGTGVDLHGGYLALIRTLGRRTGELHAALATRTGDPAFDPEPITAADVAAWTRRVGAAAAEGARSARDAAQDALRRGAVGGGRTARAARGASPRASRRTARDRVTAGKTRVHGDLHLGQVLIAQNDFMIADFEGEPARTLAERAEKQTPLKDVAGMLRSFDYAMHAALANVGPERSEAHAQLESVGREWQAQAREAFLDGYEDIARASGLALPRGDGRGLLELMLLEKAFYELRYELENRPDWVRIPLRGLSDILGPGR